MWLNCLPYTSDIYLQGMQLLQFRTWIGFRQSPQGARQAYCSTRSIYSRSTRFFYNASTHKKKVDVAPPKKKMIKQTDFPYPPPLLDLFASRATCFTVAALPDIYDVFRLATAYTALITNKLLKPIETEFTSVPHD